jgi:hypothetical protein
MIATTLPRGITILIPLRMGRRSYAKVRSEISMRFSWATVLGKRQKVRILNQFTIIRT